MYVCRMSVLRRHPLGRFHQFNHYGDDYFHSGYCGGGETGVQNDGDETHPPEFGGSYLYDQAVP